MAVKSLSIRIDEEMLNKLHVVADYEGRSANSQILILIRDAIEKYEEKHGKIEIWKNTGKLKYENEQDGSNSCPAHFIGRYYFSNCSL